MPLTVSVTFPDTLILKVIDDFMANYPEHSQSVRCVNWDYEGRRFTFIDSEEEMEEDQEDPTEHIIDEPKLRKAFELLFTDKWPRGCAKPPLSADPEVWENEFWPHTDAVDTDAFMQLAMFGEVIYG